MKLKYCLYIALILYRSTVDANNNTYRITDPVISCSTWLSTLIDQMCDSVHKIVKRDTSSSLLIEKLVPKGLQDYMNKQRLLSAEHWRRLRRQVASECCEQPCTVGTIIMYCPNNAKLLLANPDIFD